MNDKTNLFDFYQKFANEQSCLDYLEKIRWGDKSMCPHCGSEKTYKFSSGKLFKCGTCRKQFTVRIGTIFGDSKIPLQKWFMVVYLATSLKKGISSVQIHKYIGVTQKTAWFMLQRIRYAIENGTYEKRLSEEVEMDETYVGGKGAHNKRGRGAENKTPIIGLAQRKGEVRAQATVDTKRSTVTRIMRNSVTIGSTIYTDEYPVYKTLAQYGYEHQACNHAQKQYAIGNIHTNTIEGFWSHLKRGVDGVYHHVSGKHLNKYVKEYEYRYNTRGMNDLERFLHWFGLINCQLSYRRLTI